MQGMIYKNKYNDLDTSNDYKLPSIKDTTNGLSSGLSVLKSQVNKRLDSKMKFKKQYNGDDFNDNPLFTEDNPLFSDVSQLKKV
jgi:hypothetical protein